MATQQQILTVLQKYSSYDLAEQFLKLRDNSKTLQVFKLAAEQGGIYSYIIYMLYTKGKTHYWKIVDETGFSKRHIWKVLGELKELNIVDSDGKGYWVLSDRFVHSK